MNIDNIDMINKQENKRTREQENMRTREQENKLGWAEPHSRCEKWVLIFTEGLNEIINF